MIYINIVFLQPIYDKYYIVDYNLMMTLYEMLRLNEILGWVRHPTHTDSDTDVTRTLTLTLTLTLRLILRLVPTYTTCSHEQAPTPPHITPYHHNMNDDASHVVSCYVCMFHVDV